MKTKDGDYLTDAGAMQVLLDGGKVQEIEKVNYHGSEKWHYKLNKRSGQLVNEYGDPAHAFTLHHSGFGVVNRRWIVYKGK